MLFYSQNKTWKLLRNHPHILRYPYSELCTTGIMQIKYDANQIWSRRAGLCTLILTWRTVESRISHMPTSGTRRQTWGPTVRRTVKRLDKLVGTPVRFISSLTFLFLQFSFFQKHILQGCRHFDVTVCNTVKSDLKKKN